MGTARVNITQFKNIIEWTISHGLKQPILGLGAPGIGKSEVIAQLAEKYGYKLEDLRLAQMSEVEIGGLIYPSEDKTETHWLIPDWFPKQGGQKTLLLLDEITSASKRVQVAAYQLVLDRRIGQHKLPDDTIVVALGNREEDGGVYVEMAAPLANRFEIYELEVDAKVWLADYANVYVDPKTGMGINPSVIAYISAFPDELHNRTEDSEDIVFTSPRSWKRVSDILNVADSENDKIALAKVRATLGTDVYAKFKTYIKSAQFKDIVEKAIVGDKVKLPDNSLATQQLALAVGTARMNSLASEARTGNTPELRQAFEFCFNNWTNWVGNEMSQELKQSAIMMLNQHMDLLGSQSISGAINSIGKSGTDLSNIDIF